MTSITKLGLGLAISFAGAIAPAASALAGHDHYIVTPNGKCHQVARGQTAINDPDHGGYHRFHVNVHVGATESAEAPDNLGDGHSGVQVFRDNCGPR